MNRTLLFINIFTTSGACSKLNLSPINKYCFYLPKQFLSNMSGENSCQKLIDKFSDWTLASPPKYSQLPFDEVKQNYIRMNVRHAIFSPVEPTPLVHDIKLVCYSNDAVTEILNLDPSVVESEDFLAFMAGQRLPSGAVPVAHRYGGHQFGYWAGQLGDGRAILMGEYVNRLGQKWEINMKGSGRTPYSRQGDGRAVLRSSIREMIGSEALHFLGVPTTRAAALIVSQDQVLRDMFYNGNGIYEKSAIVLRLSPSWIRIGSLEILARNGEFDLLRRLWDFIIKEHYPEISLHDDLRLIRLFTEVAHRSLNLVAKWQGFGFTHGVLNTDNMSLLGLTIDYGPFGFVDSYDSGFVPNASDDEGRYSLGKQLEVVCWNLGQLASIITPSLSSAQKTQLTHILKSLELFGKNRILKVFLLKIGLKSEQFGDDQIVEKLLEMMQDTGADFTMTFWQMSELEPSQYVKEGYLEHFWALKRLSKHEQWPVWVDSYIERVCKVVDSDCGPTMEDERRRIMKEVNPLYVPRNWMLQEAIKSAENGDFSKVRFLLEVLEKPFTMNEEADKLGYASEPPKWAYRLRLSCSS